MKNISISNDNMQTLCEIFEDQNKYFDFDSLEDFIMTCINQYDQSIVLNIKNLIYLMESCSKDEVSKKFRLV